jgi:hypothetical protein
MHGQRVCVLQGDEDDKDSGQQIARAISAPERGHL